MGMNHNKNFECSSKIEEQHETRGCFFTLLLQTQGHVWKYSISAIGNCQMYCFPKIKSNVCRLFVDYDSMSQTLRLKFVFHLSTISFLFKQWISSW